MYGVQNKGLSSELKLPAIISRISPQTIKVITKGKHKNRQLLNYTKAMKGIKTNSQKLVTPDTELAEYP